MGAGKAEGCGLILENACLRVTNVMLAKVS